MAEYIDREAARLAVEQQCVDGKMLGNDESDSTLIDAYDVIDAIHDIPAADVAPVVRCKNCTHYDLGVCLKIYSDGNAHFEAWQSRNPDDFCSYGERKVVDDES